MQTQIKEQFDYKFIKKKSEQYRGPRLNGWAGAVMAIRTLKSKA